MELRDAYKKLCDNGVLKDEYKIVEKKGLTRALDFLQLFQIEWIMIMVSQIHDNRLWFENRPIKITKRIIHREIGCHTLDQPKTMYCDA